MIRMMLEPVRILTAAQAGGWAELSVRCLLLLSSGPRFQLPPPSQQGIEEVPSVQRKDDRALLGAQSP